MLAPPAETVHLASPRSRTKRKNQSSAFVFTSMARDARPRTLENRRCESRYRILGVEVRHVSLAGTVQDFSSRGLAIETSIGPRVGDSYRLELASRATSTTVTATVRWCRLHRICRTPGGKEFAPRFLAGLEIQPPVPLLDDAFQVAVHPLQKSSAPLLEPAIPCTDLAVDSPAGHG